MCHLTGIYNCCLAQTWESTCWCSDTSVDYRAAYVYLQCIAVCWMSAQVYNLHKWSDSYSCLPWIIDTTAAHAANSHRYQVIHADILRYPTLKLWSCRLVGYAFVNHGWFLDTTASCEIMSRLLKVIIFWSMIHLIVVLQNCHLSKK